MNNDRVSELYHRQFASKESQRICRDRIDWMVGAIQGRRVLDIGCSQGIATILAARAGHTVMGVEVEEPSLEYARRAVASEPVEVQSRIRLELADIMEGDLGGQRFDTVLLGEILEHHADPRRLFERATGFLAPGGIVVVSTPFGHHPHDDHKVTFYLSTFAATVEGLCRPSFLDIVDGYIRFVGRESGEPALDLDDTALLAWSERGFLAKELAYHQLVAERKRQLRRMAAEIARATRLGEQVRTLSEALRLERASRKDLSAQRKKLRAELTEKKKALREKKKLPPILPPPRDAGRVARSLAMLFGSIQHEIHTGRAFRRPHTAVFKTLYRARKAFSSVPALPAAAPDAPPAASPLPATAAQPEPVRFPPFRPLVTAKPAPITIATILDTFSESCFRFEANLVPLSVSGWLEEMERHRPAFLFCESAWLGNGGQWQYLMSKYASREPNPLRDLLAWCGATGVPRVFWNKEDPSNFDVFKDVAAEFDHVFTSDENCIPRYRDLLGHDQVYALPFAAQPAIHNPMQDEVKRTGSVCFAGSWRARKYPERATDSESLLQPALDFGLDIFDRNAGLKKSDDLAFPAPYAGAVRGGLDYDAMLSAYRGYKAFLNVNSVKDSPTMFARRVFELMACGTPVVSSDSVGIRAMLGSLVKIASTPEETRAHLERLLGDGDYRDRFAHAGYREILEHHTYRHRLETILSTLGMELPAAAPPLVTILAATNRPRRLEHLLGSIRRQIYPELEVIILLNSNDHDQAAVERQVADLPRARVFKLPESFTLAECLNHGIAEASGTWLAKFDDDDFYGAHYLSDLLLATRYTDAPILGKRACFCYLAQSDKLVLRFADFAHRHVEYVPGATLFVRRDVFEQVLFSPVIQGTDSVFQRDCRERGITIYSADPYNFIVYRGGEVGSHTWQITDEQVLAKARLVAPRLEMDAVMI